MQEQIKTLEDKRNQLVFTIGQKSVAKEIITAELLQHCQEAVNLNNEIAKMKQFVTPAPKLAPSAPAPTLEPEVQASV